MHVSALSKEECELVVAPEATRSLVAGVIQALREGDVVAEYGTVEKSEDAEALKRDIVELEYELSSMKEQLAQAKHRKERMKLLDQTPAKEVVSLVAYEKKMRDALAAELEACTAAENECVDAISGLDATLVDLIKRLDPDGPFLLPPASIEQLSDANDSFLADVQSIIEGRDSDKDDGVSSMRGIAMQELQRLQVRANSRVATIFAIFAGLTYVAQQRSHISSLKRALISMRVCVYVCVCVCVRARVHACVLNHPSIAAGLHTHGSYC